jgi:hypothetical protein
LPQTSSFELPVIQGYSVFISGDASTIAIGGLLDNNGIGAIWIFIRSTSQYIQQGPKIVASDYIGTNINQGISVCLSDDGNTLAYGGYGDNNGIGATWIWTRSGTTWTEQAKLIGINNNNFLLLLLIFLF